MVVASVKRKQYNNNQKGETKTKSEIDLSASTLKGCNQVYTLKNLLLALLHP